jgi:hypothetical protein
LADSDLAIETIFRFEVDWIRREAPIGGGLREVAINAAKLLRACGGCLGARRR